MLKYFRKKLQSTSLLNTCDITSVLFKKHILHLYSTQMTSLVSSILSTEYDVTHTSILVTSLANIYLDSFVECAEPGQVDEGGFVDGQPDPDAQNTRPDDL